MVTEQVEDFLNVANALLNGGALVLLGKTVGEVRKLVAAAIKLREAMSEYVESDGQH